MNRKELGLKMMEWHGGQNDPVYAVASFYVSGEKHPDHTFVYDAYSNLSYDLVNQVKMLNGEKVKTDKTDDLKSFAGYSDDNLRKNIAELKEILNGLDEMFVEDYS